METLTKESIQTKSSRELIQIAKELNIKNYSRNPKSILQQMILSKWEEKEAIEKPLENTKEKSADINSPQMGMDLASGKDRSASQNISEKEKNEVVKEEPTNEKAESRILSLVGGGTSEKNTIDMVSEEFGISESKTKVLWNNLVEKGELKEPEETDSTEEKNELINEEPEKQSSSTSPAAKSLEGPVELDWLMLESLFTEHKENHEDEILCDDLYNWLLIRFNIDVVDQIKEFSTPIQVIDWKEFSEFVQSFIQSKEKVEAKSKTKQQISHKPLLEFTEEQKEKTKEVMESSDLKTKRAKMITLVRMGITRQQMIKLLDFHRMRVYELSAAYDRDNTVFDKELPL